MLKKNRLKEDNSLIADFMGFKRCGFKNENFLVYIENLTPEQLGYHFSWSWLMPVIEKISNTKIKYKNVNETFYSYPRTFGMKDEEGLFMFRFNAGQLFSEKKLINAAYKAVIHFIKNYNEDGNIN